MPSCSAVGCTNRSDKNPDLSFHAVPTEKRNPKLRRQWLDQIKRSGTLPKDGSFSICSEHFEKDGFERDLQVNNFIFFCFFFSG